MSKSDKIKLYQQNVSRSMDGIYDDLLYPSIFEHATNENKHVRKHLDKTEYKKFDEDWIVKIESFFPSLNQIITNIRNTLKHETEILPVERTRRVSNASIRHLVQNTKYIKDINEDDEVYPSKVLNTVSELDYGMYENRFIMTLISRLYEYLRRRMDAINEHIHGFSQTHVVLKNSFKIGDARYDMNFELNAKEVFDSKEIDLHNMRIYERTNEAFKVVSRMYHSDFMRTMQRYKTVNPPILKTQIILKNADFRNAYTLWLYLDKLNVLDFKLQLKEEEKTFDKQYLEDIDKSLVMLFSTVYAHSNLGQNIGDEQLSNLETLEPTSADLYTYIERLNIKIPPIELEPVLATEYHLDKARQIFNRKQLSKLQIDNNPENQNYLKQVLLDQYSIADQIFNAYLKLDQDDDVFDRLLMYKHPLKKYEEALNKYLITKAARQVKERLFLDGLKLEEKWLDDLEYLQDNAIDTIISAGEKHDQSLIDAMEKEMNKSLKTLEKKEIAQSKKVLQNQRIRNNETIKNIKDKHASELKAYRMLQQKRMKEAKEKLAKKEAEERQKIKAREQIKRQKVREKLIKEKQLKIKELNAKKAATKKQLRDKVSKIK